ICGSADHMSQVSALRFASRSMVSTAMPSPTATWKPSAAASVARPSARFTPPPYAVSLCGQQDLGAATGGQRGALGVEQLGRAEHHPRRLAYDLADGPQRARPG